MTQFVQKINKKKHPKNSPTKASQLLLVESKIPIRLSDQCSRHFDQFGTTLILYCLKKNSRGVELKDLIQFFLSKSIQQTVCNSGNKLCFLKLGISLLFWMGGGWLAGETENKANYVEF